MATINSLEDFLQALDDNPSWREAIRLRILGEELLQLPARFNAFAERQQEFNERVAGFIEEQRGVNERQQETNERVERTLEELLRLSANAEARMDRMDNTLEELLRLSANAEARMDRMDNTLEKLIRLNANAEARMDRMDNTLEELIRLSANAEARMNRMDNTLEELLRLNANAEARMNRMESDISAVKGGHVRTRLYDLSYDLIEGMNLELAHVLERNELTLMSRRIPDATANERESFRRADMVILAADRTNGAPVYLAAEASWTGSKNDTDRAERNARFLTEATGIPAIPVIASVRNTREVTGFIESGAVRWYRIEERDLQAE